MDHAERIQRTLAYIEANLDRDIRLDRLARQCSPLALFGRRFLLDGSLDDRRRWNALRLNQTHVRRHIARPPLVH